MTDNEIIVETLKCVATMTRRLSEREVNQAHDRLLKLADSQTFERLADKQEGFKANGLHATIRLHGDTREWLNFAMVQLAEIFPLMDSQTLSEYDEDYNWGWSFDIEGEPCNEGDVRGR